MELFSQKKSIACQIASPFHKKLGCFLKLNLKIALQMIGEVIWKAIDSV